LNASDIAASTSAKVAKRRIDGSRLRADFTLFNIFWQNFLFKLMKEANDRLDQMAKDLKDED
jgi:hypothetical protein